MDKATRRQIKEFEKRAGEAARLKEKAANLLKKADDIEVAQKSAFEAIIVKTAYAMGLDALPLGTIVAGFAAMSGVSKPERAGGDFSSVAKASGCGGDDVQSDATIDLIVEIGRNTTKERFAVLDQYLTWNGRNGEWSGKVSRAVLAIFEGLFEPRQLKYSMHDLRNVEGGSSNTSSPVMDNVANTARDQDPTSSESLEAVDGVRQAMAADIDNQAADQPETTGPVSGELATREATNSEPDKAVGLGPEGTAAGTDGPQDTQGTVGPVKSDTSTVADDRKPSASSKPTAASLMPRSPFAGLRRHGQG